MVESPTYYRAYQPILKTLQGFDVENMPFTDELVYLKTGPHPNFLHPDVQFDSSVVYTELPEDLKKQEEEEMEDHQDECGPTSPSWLGHHQISLQDFFKTAHNDQSIFDEYQEEAVKECLRNRIGIIQGPPGCGKTFIGIHMLRLLLSLESLHDPKVLVLTYKNHALDEFLKGIMRFVSKIIIYFQQHYKNTSSFLFFSVNKMKFRISREKFSRILRVVPFSPKFISQNTQNS